MNKQEDLVLTGFLRLADREQRHAWATIKLIRALAKEERRALVDKISAGGELAIRAVGRGKCICCGK